jgi:nicotinamidase-related amidase
LAAPDGIAAEWRRERRPGGQCLKSVPAPEKNPDLHGNVPDRCEAALLLIDLINDFEFEGAEPIFRQTLAAAPAIAALKRRARAAGVPVLYVNDNFGKWQSDFRNVLDHCLKDDVRGRPVAEMLRPEADDYFVLKPKHSGFYTTTLELLLRHLNARTLILAGIAGNNCVLFTANDAYLRDFDIVVPRDCTASETREDNEYALAQMAKVLKADTRASTEIDFASLRGKDGR